MSVLAQNVPMRSPIELKRSLIFPILLFSSISLHCSVMKAFLSLLAILWDSAFSWVYLSLSLPSPSLLFSGIWTAFLDNHFAFLHFILFGVILVTTSCTSLQTSIHSSSSALSTTLTLESICHLHCILINHLIRSYLNGLMVFPTFFNLSLNFSVRSS